MSIKNCSTYAIATLIAVICLLFISCLRQQNSAKMLANSQWNTFGGDITHRGNFVGQGPQTNRIRWKFNRVGLFQHANNYLYSSLVMDDHNNVIFHYNEHLYCLDGFSGVVQWTSMFPSGTHCLSPTVSASNVVYFADTNGVLYAISNGSSLWQYKANDQIRTTPLITSDDRVIIADQAGTIICLDEYGKVLWELSTGYRIISSPTCDTLSTCYIGSSAGVLAFDSDGNVVWHRQLDAQVGSAIVLYGDCLYLTTVNGKLYSVSTDGDVLWNIQLSSSSYSTPAVSNKCNIFVGSSYGLHCVESTGKEIWKMPAGCAVTSSPCVDAKEVVYYGDGLGNIYAVQNSKSVWSYKAQAGVAASPALGPDGALYIATVECLYAFGE